MVRGAPSEAAIVGVGTIKIIIVDVLQRELGILPGIEGDLERHTVVVE